MITCKHDKMRIDVLHESKQINARVGCYPDKKDNGDNQKWSIEMIHESEHEKIKIKKDLRRKMMNFFAFFIRDKKN